MEEEMQNQPMPMDPEQMAEKKTMVVGMCTCKDCPSYFDCQENIGYCLPTIGKSGCIKKKKGCICSDCPVTAKMGLTHGYYCIDGSEKEQIAQDGAAA